MHAVVKIPSPDPAYLTVLVSGLTASISLTEARIPISTRTTSTF